MPSSKLYRACGPSAYSGSFNVLPQLENGNQKDGMRGKYKNKNQRRNASAQLHTSVTPRIDQKLSTEPKSATERQEGKEISMGFIELWKHDPKFRVESSAVLVGAAVLVVYVFQLCAMLSSNKLTRTAIENNGKQFQIDQRPYIWRLEHGSPKNVRIVKDEPMTFNINWVNSGKSPAVMGTVVGEIFIGETARQQAAAWFDKVGSGPLPKGTEMDSAVVPPGIPSDPDKPLGSFSTIRTRKRLTQEDVDYIMNTDYAIVIVVRYQYFDMFGNIYWSDMCMSRFKNGNFPNCKNHNVMH